jgi:hypothetical protein
MDYTLSQNIWASITQLGALCATDGVDEQTKKLANEQIQELLKMLKPMLVKMAAQTAGIVTTTL